MRLVCPNCEAKYEVPEDAIPETGRDVQCANCGHAWFQMRAYSPAAEPAPAVAAPVAPPPAAPVDAPVDAPLDAPVAAAAMPDPAPEPDAEPEPPEPVAEPPVEVAAEVAAEVDEVDVPAVETAEDVVEPLIVAESAVEPVAADDSAVPETATAADAEPVEPATEQPTAAEVALAEALATEPAAAEAVEVLSPVPDTLVGDVAETGVDAAPTDEDDTDADPAADPAPVAEAAYAVDESVLAILREEAEREVQARRTDAKPLEVQTDLGIDAAMPAAKRAVEVISSDIPDAARIGTGMDDVEARPSARRDLLPNVEEINSTLRPSDHPADGEVVSDVPAPEVTARSSFRSGFLLVMTVTILASALYMSADALSAAIPALAGPLDAFVGFVDGLRLQLDGLMRNATVAINGNGT